MQSNERIKTEEENRGENNLYLLFLLSLCLQASRGEPNAKAKATTKLHHTNSITNRLERESCRGGFVPVVELLRTDSSSSPITVNN